LGYLQSENSVFVLGCNGCAQASGTGGPKQVEEIKAKLESAGKRVTGTSVVDFLCEKALIKSKLRTRVAQLEAADSILVMTCGIGIQAVAASVNKACHPGCDTVNLGGSRGEWQGSERCRECGECVLESTGGICPLTACTKGLLSGQCGGASHGMCEISPERECGWEAIYNRLKSKGQLAKLLDLAPAKDYGKMMPQAEMMATAQWALERPTRSEAK
jgi:hypothetical protein